MTELPGRVAKALPKGHKVLLRDKRWGDAEQDHKWKTDPEIAQLDATLPVQLSLSQFRALHIYQPPFADWGGHTFAIDTLDGEHIGNCMYYNLDKHTRSVEIGVIIGERSYWNKGYGTEAISLLVNHIFQELRVEKIYLHTLEWNLRAHRAFEKCGFSTSGVRNRDKYTFMVMELQRSQWEKASTLEEEPPGE
jgi:RimJ/RimL family protein N-acetyltransferase